MDRQKSTFAEPVLSAANELVEGAVHPTKRRWVNEALVVKGLLGFAVVAAGLGLLAEDGNDGPLSAIWAPLNDFFASVGLIPSALAVALVITVYITRMPPRPDSSGPPEEAIVMPPVQDVSEALPAPAETPEAVEPEEPATDYESQVRAMAESVAAWSPPEGVDPASDFAEILSRRPPPSPWG